MARIQISTNISRTVYSRIFIFRRINCLIWNVKMIFCLLSNEQYFSYIHCSNPTHDKVYSIKILIKCPWHAAGLRFSPDPPVSSTNITDRHDITEILSKVSLNTITPNLKGILKIVLTYVFSTRDKGCFFSI
jgi:hypothetical protein